MKNLHNIPEIGNFAAENRINTSSMKRIVFATGNSGKLREASEILGGAFELVTPAQSGISGDIPESGATLRANSLQKAQYIYDHTGFAKPAFKLIAVDILGGAPGVYSARYAGSSKNSSDNIDKLLREMDIQETEASFARAFGIDTVHATRRARFKTVVTLILGGEKHFFEGVLEGRIARSRAGEGGFGYDPVFIADEYPDRTVAELDEETKNAISHRGKALRAMAEFLNSQSA